MPEGEWVEDESGLSWHKSDFFGRFVLHVPVVESGEVHLSVPEGEEEGACVLAVRSGALSMVVGKKEVGCHRVDGDAFEIEVEDHWVWVTAGGKPLLKHFLTEPMRGSRLWVSGFTTEDLHKSYAVRYRVNDCLFKEAPYSWIANGGQWQVVNRFTCRPRWSHMNGESAEGVAAMWTRCRYRGDFCVEMYAGMRHRWYKRCGDWNLTMMSSATTPSRGYTVTCTGWDPDHSQRFTTLYRNGQQVARSDAYLAPRYREGNERKWINPLVPEGRPIHGAWFYMKLRRIGKRVEYYFDNQRVFSFDEDEPLDGGLAGIWTYMNSMMVARVKVAAREIEPLEIPFKALGPERPVKVLTPAVRDWQAADPVGQAVVRWHSDEDGEPYFTVGSPLGSGSMHAKCVRAAKPYSEIAGWRFRVKRTPGACLNFHYTIGHLYDSGKSPPKTSYFHRLSGTDFSKGDRKLCGHTTVAAVSGAGPDWHRRGPWTPVTVWLPPHVSERGRVGVIRVRVEGFGNLQPSLEAQGLRGNGPGEGYAIKGFTEIPYRHPTPEPVITCAWSDTIPNALVLRSSATSPDRRFAFARVFIEGAGAVLDCRPRFSERIVRLPRCRELCRERIEHIAARVNAGEAVRNFRLSWAACPTRQGPVLVGVEGITPLLENYEAAGDSKGRRRPRKQVCHDDAVQGRYLEVSNTELNQRLKHEFVASGSLAGFPLMQFRYRAPAMAQVSLRFGDTRLARISENHPEACCVRAAPGFSHNGQWTTWRGVVADVVREVPFTKDAFTFRNLEFGSFCEVDQTGQYTSWALDDVVIGPAVASGERLAFTPDYFDFDGIQTVSMALRSGREGFSELGAAASGELVWQTVANRQRVTPRVDGLEDGICHLFLRAQDRQGDLSAVTDVPFLLDTVPLKARAAFVETRHPLSNGSFLQVDFETGGGAPPELADLEIAWDGQEIELDDFLNTFEHTPEGARITLNWPYILRDRLHAATGATALDVQIRNIVDGAGSSVPDITVPLRVARETDKTGPAFLPSVYPINVFFVTSWEGRSEEETYLKTYSRNKLEVVREWGEPAYLTTETYRGVGRVHATTRIKGRGGGREYWELAKYPYLAFRMRRPVIEKNDPTRIVLLLYHGDEEHYSIALTPKPEGSDLLSLKDPIPWEEGKWHSVIINVRDILPPEDADKPISLRALHITRQRRDTPEALHIKDLYVLGEWREPARWPQESLVKLNAYDINGLDGIDWEHVDGDGKLLQSGHSDAVALAPAALGLTPGKNRWLVMRVRDRAGNLSAPLRIPFVNGSS